MVALVLLSLTAGIATTIGTVALLAILFRSSVGAALIRRLPSIERNARVLQGIAGAVIVAIALWSGARLFLA
jgi:hypothetical protein